MIQLENHRDSLQAAKNLALIMSSSSAASSSSSAASAGANQACAACKFQRRRCSSECPLARYFPADNNQRFMNCKRLFGVSNMVRFLKEVPPADRDDTMKSLVYEADVRERDPVYGCLGVVNKLRDQLNKLTDELKMTRMQLSYYADQAKQQQLVISSLYNSVADHPEHHHQQQQQHQLLQMQQQIHPHQQQQNLQLLPPPHQFNLPHLPQPNLPQDQDQEDPQNSQQRGLNLQQNLNRFPAPPAAASSSCDDEDHPREEEEEENLTMRGYWL